jgi:hypothetical protein
MLLGHVLQAHELFAKVVRMPPSMDESAHSQTARDEAARLSKELEPRIPTLRLKLTLPAGASAVVHIDDEPIPLTGPETSRAVDPGPHDIVAKAGEGPEQKIRVDLAETETKEVALAPHWVAPKPPPPPPSTQIIYVRTTNPLAFLGFGVAAAALIVTGVGIYVASNARSEAADKCGSAYCPPASARDRALPSTALENRDFQELNTRYNGALILTGIAGAATVAFLAVGIIGVARPIKEKVTASVRPVVGPRSAGLVGTF